MVVLMDYAVISRFCQNQLPSRELRLRQAVMGKKAASSDRSLAC